MQVTEFNLLPHPLLTPSFLKTDFPKNINWPGLGGPLDSTS